MAGNRKAPAGKRAVPSTAALIARNAVNVVDISRGGCLLETSRPFEPGTVGTLELMLNGRAYVEDFRVARCLPLSGRGSTYRVGVEFLRTRREPESSLRYAVPQLVAMNQQAANAAPVVIVQPGLAPTAQRPVVES